MKLVYIKLNEWIFLFLILLFLVFFISNLIIRANIISVSQYKPQQSLKKPLSGMTQTSGITESVRNKTFGQINGESAANNEKINKTRLVQGYGIPGNIDGNSIRKNIKNHKLSDREALFWNQL